MIAMEIKKRAKNSRNEILVFYNKQNQLAWFFIHKVHFGETRTSACVGCDVEFSKLFLSSQRQVTDYKEEKIDGAEKIRYRVYR